MRLQSLTKTDNISFQASRRDFFKTLLIASAGFGFGLGAMNFSNEYDNYSKSAKIEKINLKEVEGVNRNIVVPGQDFSYPLNNYKNQNQYIALIDEAVEYYAGEHQEYFKNPTECKTLNGFMKGFKEGVSNEDKIKLLTRALSNSDVPNSIALEASYLAIAKITYDNIENKDSKNFLNQWYKDFSNCFSGNKSCFNSAIKLPDDYIFVPPKASDKEFRGGTLFAMGGKDWCRCLDDGQFNAGIHVALGFGKTLNELADFHLIPGTLLLREEGAMIGAKLHEKRDHPVSKIGDSAEDLSSSLIMVKLAVKSFKNQFNPFEIAANMSEVLRCEKNQILSLDEMNDLIRKAHKFAWNNNYKGCYHVSRQVYERNQEKLKHPELLHKNEIFLYNHQTPYENSIIADINQ